MAYRRQGYGGGRPYFNTGGPVNPWQVGNAPGNQGNQIYANQPNLLSQLSEPQAQLALAISKLLQPQQQVPSLLTMNTVNPLQNNASYGQNNYLQRGRNMPNNRRPRHDMKPFNKMNNRNNRDTDFNRRGISNKKSQPHQRSTVVSKPKKSSSTSTVTKASSKSPGKTAEAKVLKKEEVGDVIAIEDTTNVSVSEAEKSDDAEKSEKKRDWKEEKNDVIEIIEDTKDDEKKEEENAKKEENKEKPTEEVEEKSTAIKSENKYEGIPQDLLHCHICQKNMWDGDSYEKHMNGYAHTQMYKKVEEGYRIRADMMREAIRLREEKHNIEMDRMKRLGKKTKAHQLNHCAMCDLDFYGQLFIHRKSLNHQKLKHFLHPRCSYCNKEFPTRMEWENHRHSIEHLRKKSENMSKQKAKTETDEEEITLEDDNFIVLDSIENDEQGSQEDDSNVITDFIENYSDITEDQIPAYKSGRSVGASLVSPASGFYCKPCSRFFSTEEISQQHTKTKQHYDKFIQLLHEKIAENQEKKRKIDEEEDGNWKRRKVIKTNDDSNQETTLELNDSNMSNGDQYYDPEESFNVTDSINTSTDVKTTDNEITQETETTIEDKLETTVEEPKPVEVVPEVQEKPKVEMKSPNTPTVKKKVPAKISRPQKAIRGRKHN